MNQEPVQPDKEFGKDLRTFEKLPTKTKELSLLQQEAEKTIGPVSVAINKVIQEKAGLNSSQNPAANIANSTPAQKS